MKQTDREEQCQKKKEAGEREGRKKRRQFCGEREREWEVTGAQEELWHS